MVQEHNRTAAGVLLWVVCMGLITPVEAVAEGRVHVWAKAAAEAWNIRATDHDSVRRRRITQLLGVYGWYDTRPQAERGPFQLMGIDTSLRLTTDVGPESPELARLDPGGNRLADIHVMTFYGELNRLGGVMDLRLGRQNLLNPVGWFDFDGITTRLHSPSGWNVTLYGGLPVNEGGQSIDSSLLGDVGTVGREVDGFDDRTVLMGVGLGYTSSILRLQWALHRVAFVQHSRPATPTPLDPSEQQVTDALDPTVWPTGQDVRQEQTGLALYASPTDTVDLTAEALYNIPVRDLDRVYLDTTVWMLSRDLRVGAALESDRPRFDLDSSWNVYGARPSGGYRLHAGGELPTLWGGGVTLQGAVLWRAYGGPDGQGLILPGLIHEPDPEEVFGGQLSVRWQLDRPNRRWFPSMDLQLSTRGEEGQGGRLLQIDGRGRLGLLYDIWLDIYAMGLTTDRTW
ncbi:MAG: hypothetical protein AAFS10_18900, partial [Myxococcota bacterium]